LKEFGLDNYLNLEAKQQPTWDSQETLEKVKEELSVKRMQPQIEFEVE
jgi:hypothetical protein